jgi:hypothetical protein
MEIAMKSCLVSLVVLGAIGATAGPVSATAQPTCGERSSIIEMLAKKYHEQPRAMAIANQRMLLEVYASQAGSWTILLTHPNGATCIVSAGDSWEEIPDTKKFTSL